jgi:S-formylglutathione hydrolase FrmB
MSFFTGTIYSQALDMDTSVGIILPQDSREHVGVDALHKGITARKTPKTIILLHGLSDNFFMWGGRTSILRYAEAYDVAVLMPDVQRSYYQDLKNGPAYFTYISDELPRLASELFNISIKSEDLMIAGLSMGGYGALYAALTYPERYYGVGCFSSGFDLRDLVENNTEWGVWEKDRRGIFGESLKVPESSDLYHLVGKTAKKSKKPRIFMTCGTEDFLYKSNIKMRDLIASSKAFDFKYEEWPGVHEWGFWDTSIQKMLEHFLAP